MLYFLSERTQPFDSPQNHFFIGSNHGTRKQVESNLSDPHFQFLIFKGFCFFRFFKKTEIPTESYLSGFNLNEHLPFNKVVCFWADGMRVRFIFMTELWNLN